MRTGHNRELSVIASTFLHHIDVSKSVFTRKQVGLTIDPAVDDPWITAVDNVFTKNYDGVNVKPAVVWDVRGIRLGGNTALKNTRYRIYVPTRPAAQPAATCQPHQNRTPTGPAPHAQDAPVMDVIFLPATAHTVDVTPRPNTKFLTYMLVWLRGGRDPKSDWRPAGLPMD